MANTLLPWKGEGSLRRKATSSPTQFFSSLVFLLFHQVKGWRHTLPPKKERKSSQRRKATSSPTRRFSVCGSACEPCGDEWSARNFSSRRKGNSVYVCVRGPLVSLTLHGQYTRQHESCNAGEGRGLVRWACQACAYPPARRTLSEICDDPGQSRKLMETRS
jgi:hypothetical protein